MAVDGLAGPPLIFGIDLVTGEHAVRPYRAWRDLGLAHAAAGGGAA